MDAFRIVTKYEDFAAGLRAVQMLERLSARLRSEFQLISSVWKFELLDNRTLRDQAAAEAAAADLIIISTSSAADLPDSVKNWIAGWVPNKQGYRTALVALFGREETSTSQPPPVWTYLRDAAENAKMDFFCNVGGWRQQESEQIVKSGPPARSPIRHYGTGIFLQQPSEKPPTTVREPQTPETSANPDMP